MSIISSADTGGADLPEIANSLRFDGTNDYLSKSFSGSGGNPWTFSSYIKRSSLGVRQIVFSANGGANTGFGFDASDRFVFFSNGGADQVSTAVSRDPSAHAHLVVNSNGTTVNAWVDNALVANITIAAQYINTAVSHNIGRLQSGSLYFDGYLSNVCFIDGQALTPSSFAYTDPNGQWRSLAGSALKALADAGGTNSCFLDFSNSGSLGQDKSAKGNNWTLNNFPAASLCQMTDTPTNNYATLNPNARYLTAITTSNGNLTATKSATSDQPRVFGTIGVSSGAWYWEVTPTALTGPSNFYLYIGVGSGNMTSQYDPDWVVYTGTNDSGSAGYKNIRTGGSGLGTPYGANYTANDVIGVALDCDANTITFYKNGVSQGTITSIQARLWFPFHFYEGSSTTGALNFNFGQRAFAYSPPTGFKALCTKNLPVPTGAAAEPKKHFGVVTRTGSSSPVSVSSLLFAPDAIDTKSRNTGDAWNFVDRVRGTSANLQTNSTAAEDSVARLTSFDANGYTFAGGYGVTNAAGQTFVDFCWKAGGAAVTNTAGSISSQVSANPAAGFSIVTYTGTGANATVGHGLGVAPKMVIVKCLGVATDWVVYHGQLLNTEYLSLNTTGSKASAATMWNSTSPTSSVFSLGSIANDAVNGATRNYVAYCFAEVAGYSKIGSYTGNGSDNGPFVWCGFKPRWLMVKRSDSTSNWEMIDSVRDVQNQMYLDLAANLSNAENIDGAAWDFLANGFKCRDGGSSGNKNVSGATYIYLAIAEQPFQWSNAR